MSPDSALKYLVARLHLVEQEYKKGQLLPFAADGRHPLYLVVSGEVAWTQGMAQHVCKTPPLVVGLSHLVLPQKIANMAGGPTLTNGTVVAAGRGYETSVEEIQRKRTEPLEFAQLCNALRVLSVQGGWDPFLHCYQYVRATTDSDFRPFVKVLHPCNGGMKDLKLNMRVWQKPPGASVYRGWQPVIEQDKRPSGLLMIWNGFVRASVKLEPNADPWVVTAYRAPAFAGEFERPLAEGIVVPEIADIPSPATVDVLPDPYDPYLDNAVLALEMPFTEYLRCCQGEASLPRNMTAFVRERTRLWLPQMAARQTYTLRLCKFILEEAVALGRTPIKVSMTYFKAAMGFGDNQKMEQPPDLLEKFHKEGLLVLHGFANSPRSSGARGARTWMLNDGYGKFFQLDSIDERKIRHKLSGAATSTGPQQVPESTGRNKTPRR